MLVDPNSFKGKIWLLVVDKVIIGALIGFVLLSYSVIKTNEERSYIEKREEIQLSIKQAELKKQFLPIVLDNSKNVRERVHSLISLIQTNSIDSYGAISLAGDILEDSKLNPSGYLEWEKHPDLRYLKYELYKIAPDALPGLLDKYLTEYAYHLEDFHHSQQGDNTTLSLAKNAETGLWIDLLRYALNKDPNSFEDLNNRKFLVNHLESFDAITPTISDDEAILWSNSNILGLKLIGIIELLQKKQESEKDIQFLIKHLGRKNDDTDYFLNSILFDLIHNRAILSKDISNVALKIIIDHKETVENQLHHFRKGDPRITLFYKASNYLIWSCKFSQIDSAIEKPILSELEQFVKTIKKAEVDKLDRVNSPLERVLLETRITSNSAMGLPPSETSRELLDNLFMMNDPLLDAYNILDLKVKWQRIVREKSIH